MKYLIFIFFALSFQSIVAQTKSDENIHPVIMINGAVVEISYDKGNSILNVEVSQNEDVVEVIAVKDGVVVNSESTVFTDDEMSLDLSNYDNGEYDIYIRTSNEVQNAGSVITGLKPEE